MLTCNIGQTTINIIDTTYDKYTLKQWSDKGILKCPVCNGEYEYCHGEIVSPYFRHKHKECEGYYSESETDEHKQGKILLYNWLKNQKGIENLKLEAWIPETKQRPDIYFEQNGKRFVIEYQCTPIATEFLKRRELYKLNGITDIWILGTKKYNIKKIDNIRYKAIEKELHKHKQLVYLGSETQTIYFQSDHKLYKQNSIHFHKSPKRFSENNKAYLINVCESEFNTYCSMFFYEDIIFHNIKDFIFNSQINLSPAAFDLLNNIVVTVTTHSHAQWRLEKEIKDRKIKFEQMKRNIKVKQMEKLFPTIKYQHLLQLSEKSSQHYDFLIKAGEEYFFFIKSNKIDFCVIDRITRTYSKFVNLDSMEIANIFDKSVKNFIERNIKIHFKGRLNEKK